MAQTSTTCYYISTRLYNMYNRITFFNAMNKHLNLFTHFLTLIGVCPTVYQLNQQSNQPFLPLFLSFSKNTQWLVQCMESYSCEDRGEGSTYSNIKQLWEISASHCFDLPFIPPSRQKGREHRPGVKSTFHSPLTPLSARSILPLFNVFFSFFLYFVEREKESERSWWIS